MNKTRYTAEQRSNALALVAEIGKTAASKELGIAYVTLCNWERRRHNLPWDVEHIEKLREVITHDKTVQEANDRLQIENAELREINAMLKDCMITFIEKMCVASTINAKLPSE